MIDVYQLTPEAFSKLPPFLTREEQVKRFFTDQRSYRLVARVDTEELELAFQLTNTIERSWWKNSKVAPLFDGTGCRSTSVGDMLQRPDGKRFVVCSLGFAEIE